MTKVGIGDTVKGSYCQWVDHLYLSLLGLDNIVDEVDDAGDPVEGFQQGKLKIVPGTDVMSTGKLLLASRKSDYVAQYSNHNLAICEDVKPFAQGGQVLRLALKVGAIVPQENYIYSNGTFNMALPYTLDYGPNMTSVVKRPINLAGRQHWRIYLLEWRRYLTSPGTITGGNENLQMLYSGDISPDGTPIGLPASITHHQGWVQIPDMSAYQASNVEVHLITRRDDGLWPHLVLGMFYQNVGTPLHWYNPNTDTVGYDHGPEYGPIIWEP